MTLGLSACSPLTYSPRFQNDLSKKYIWLCRSPSWDPGMDPSIYHPASSIIMSHKRHFKVCTLLCFSGWDSSTSVGPKRSYKWPQKLPRSFAGFPMLLYFCKRSSFCLEYHHPWYLPPAQLCALARAHAYTHRIFQHSAHVPWVMTPPPSPTPQSEEFLCLHFQLFTFLKHNPQHITLSNLRAGI